MASTKVPESQNVSYFLTFFHVTEKANKWKINTFLKQRVHLYKNKSRSQKLSPVYAASSNSIQQKTRIVL